MVVTLSISIGPLRADSAQSFYWLFSQSLWASFKAFVNASASSRVAPWPTMLSTTALRCPSDITCELLLEGDEYVVEVEPLSQPVKTQKHRLVMPKTRYLNISIPFLKLAPGVKVWVWD